MRAVVDFSYAGLSVLWLAAIVFEVVRRKRAGRVLFDIGPNPHSGMLRGFGVLMLLIGVAFLPLDAYRAAMHILWGLWYLLWATRRVQIREAGILAKRKLIGWRELLGFSLESDGILRFRMQAPEGKFIGCAIPTENRDQVRHIVSLRLPLLPTS